MQEELDQFTRSRVWSLVPRPSNHHIVGAKWVFRNKVDEQENVVRNKARLVAKGYNQEEGIDYDETFTPVARIEAIRLLLAFACFLNFKLFQMDVKSAFLNGLIQEEVYVEQPPSFEDFEKSYHVFKFHKALYGLKQALRAWYERLSKYLVEKGYDKGNIDTTLFIKRYLNDLIIVQIYVDDIVFGATNEALCKNFAKEMQGEFEMSMMGELRYFLGLQIKQSEEGIFINQERYTHDMLKKFDMLKLKSISTPLSPSTKIDLDEKGKMYIKSSIEIDGKPTDQGEKLQKVEEKITELENNLKEQESMPSESVAADNSTISSTTPTQQGAEGSAKSIEKSTPHVGSSGIQAEGSIYKSASLVLQTEDSPQGVD
ncbi:Reverse transcriptase [Theobroma cacao]|nr:Reverse transcriptase [Theobroma cacao]